MKKFLIAVILFAGGITACQNMAALPDPVANMATQPGWKPDAGNPIIRAGDFRKHGLWNDAHVIREAGGYTMYLTTSTPENPFKPPILPFRARSADGLKWHLDPDRPLFDATGTPFVSAETPSVVYFHGQYHLYYTGVYPQGAPSPFAIGHAVSKDGVNWVKDAQPVLRATGRQQDWNGFLVGEPGAVVLNDEIRVYFSAVQQLPGGKPAIAQVIGVATSLDGKTFSSPLLALRAAEPYAGAQGFAGFSTPFALAHDGVVHLFHDVATYRDGDEPAWQQVALGHAVSTDAGKTFREDGKPIFTRGSFDWTAGEILAPAALVEDGRLRLWFSGHLKIQDFGPMIRRGIVGPEFGIGYAEIALDALTTQ